jgi:hypothetical protein
LGNCPSKPFVRLSERERVLGELQRNLAEERRLVEEWRTPQRTTR